MTLLLIDLLVVKGVAKRTSTAILSIVLIAVIAWPTVFFGQKWLVDHFIVEPSSAEQRKDAFFSSLLRSSLAHNALQIEGIPYEADHATTPSEMTFLALMGGLIYSNEAFLDSVDKQKGMIVERYLINRAGSEFDGHYAQYQEMRTQVNGAWKEYEKANNKYYSAVNGRTKEANKAWGEVETQVLKGWNDYQRAEKAYLVRAEARAQELAPKIYANFEERNRCIDRYNQSESRFTRCINNNEANYKKSLKKYGLPYRELDFWLVKESREKGTTTVKESIMTLGISALLAGIEIAAGDGGKVEEKMVFSRHVSDYTPKILGLMQGQFERETGYPMGIATLTEFRHNKVTAQKVRSRVAKDGLTLPKTWSLKQITVFKNAVNTKILNEANRRWKAEMDKRGMEMKPGLNFASFQRHSDIQDQIKAQMGERFYVEPMLTTWNNKAFYNNVIMVNINRERDYWLNYMESAVSQFEDGAPMAEDGKNALRSIIVPPISMSISLLLVLVTFLKLPFKFWKLLSYNDENLGVITPSEKIKAKRIEQGVGLLIIAAIFIVPVVLGKSKFTDENTTTGYFLSEIDKMVSPVGSTFLTWVLHTQPVIQPVGNAFETNFGLFSLFEKTLMTTIDALDKQVYSMISPSVSHEKDNLNKTAINEQREAVKKHGHLIEVPFTVRTNVNTAKIRVLNIKPRYQEGMMLALGNYHVEVSAPGYTTLQKWVSHSQKQNVHMFQLTK
ncbi:hypothetical protein C9I90_00315 [Photobacterium aphoticum]|nr:hypothetical protein C9I90_00315 [Photobacterium aphoticum]